MGHVPIFLFAFPPSKSFKTVKLPDGNGYHVRLVLPDWLGTKIQEHYVHCQIGLPLVVFSISMWAMAIFHGKLWNYDRGYIGSPLPKTIGSPLPKTHWTHKKKKRKEKKRTTTTQTATATATTTQLQLQLRPQKTQQLHKIRTNINN